MDPKQNSINNNNDFGDENDEILKQNAILLRRNSVQGNIELCFYRV